MARIAHCIDRVRGRVYMYCTSVDGRPHIMSVVGRHLCFCYCWFSFIPDCFDSDVVAGWWAAEQ